MVTVIIWRKEWRLLLVETKILENSVEDDRGIFNGTVDELTWLFWTVCPIRNLRELGGRMNINI